MRSLSYWKLVSISSPTYEDRARFCAYSGLFVAPCSELGTVEEASNQNEISSTV